MKKSSITNHPSSISFWHPASLISTCFGVGKIPFAPGTFGSLAGFLFIPAIIGLFFFVSLYLGPFTFTFVGVFLIAFVFYSIKSIKIYCERTGKKDPKEVVIDEVVGQIIAFIITLIISNYTVGIIYSAVISFLLFRFFDIVKPGPVGWADRNVKGAWGVMLDDIIAGVLAGICSAGIFLLV